MVDRRPAAISSTITSTLVSASHGTAHYLTEGSQSLQDPSVMIAGGTVFAATFTLSYLGMRQHLPF